MLHVLSLCRVQAFAERLALGKDVLCQERAFAERLALGKDVLCRASPFAEGTTLGKEFFGERCRCRGPCARQRWPLPSAR